MRSGRSFRISPRQLALPEARGDHPVEHVEPKAQIAETRREQKQDVMCTRLPKANCGQRSRNNR